jgi:hypothetical protein
MRGDENNPGDCKLAIHATRKLMEKLDPEYSLGDNTRDWYPTSERASRTGARQAAAG